MLSLCFSGVAQDTENLPLKFQNISIESGLSNMSVQKIGQDSRGFIWIATARGLNRYDGVSFRHYFYNDDTSSLYHDFIGEMLITRNNRVYCATSYGLNCFDLQKEKMLRISCNNDLFSALVEWNDQLYGCGLTGGLSVLSPDDVMLPVPGFDRSFTITSLLADGENGIWCISPEKHVLIHFHPSDNLYLEYPLPTSEDFGDVASTANIIRLNDFLLIGCNSGLLAFHPASHQFLPLPAYLADLNTLNNKEITFISTSVRDMLYIGTKEHGLFGFNLKDHSLKNFRKSTEKSGLKSSFLTSFLKDRDENIWIGTFDHGIDVSFERRKNFNFDLNLNKITREHFITAVVSDNQGKYYIGTRNAGLLIYNSDSRATISINASNGSFQSNHVRSLYLDTRMRLWIGTERKLHLLDTSTGNVKTLEDIYPNNGVVCFCENANYLFAGTDIQGILVYDNEGRLVDTLKELGKNITQIIPGSDNRLLVSSYGHGIFELEYPSGKSRPLIHQDTLPTRKLIEAITLFVDSEGLLWIGNFKYGLYRYNLRTHEFASFSTADGLPSNDITAITEDFQHFLWISTAYGLSRFDKQKSFINFYLNEGVENLQFHQKAAFRDATGVIFFGGNYGLTYFNPENLGINLTTAPRIVLQTLRVSNKPVIPDDETGILKKSLDFTDRIVLSSKFPVFSIEYIAFDFISANNLRYAYMLDGFEDTWNLVDNRTFANYSNLKPGEYVFKVKAQNNNGIWSEELASLDIRIKPAPWKTAWAIAIYLFALACAVYVAFRLILQAQLFKKELEIEHHERMQEQDINQMKLRFFTNISHEIRTPLTLIKGNVEQLAKLSALSSSGPGPIQGIKYNTDRLLKLVNQLLSFRKLENDTLALEISHNDIISITREILESFRYLASSRKVDLHLQTGFDVLRLPLDQDKYEKILSNLIANAIKFSRAHSRVTITIDFPGSHPDYKPDSRYGLHETNLRYVEIKVEDRGKGIPSESIPFIFDRYMQSGSGTSGKPDYSGTGIGLYFSKRLVEMHHGCITVSSKENTGTVFSFLLPLDDSAYLKDEWLRTITGEGRDPRRGGGKPILKSERNTGQKVILVAEDDPELNTFICNTLSENFVTIAAFDGEVALRLAQKQLPDIIILDIMMPRIDGITLCRLIREDPLISHIPVILLTAKTDIESQKSGLSAGADDYITKPFETELLLARIENLLKQRTRLQQLYRKGSMSEIQSVELNKFEQNFMQKIELVIEKEFHDPDFNVQVLADRINMSRTNFYRKFVKITSLTPKEYLTRYRIDQSIRMMQSDQDNVGEISYRCGFGSQSLFTLAFKKEKGQTPLAYRKQLPSQT